MMGKACDLIWLEITQKADLPLIKFLILYIHHVSVIFLISSSSLYLDFQGTTSFKGLLTTAPPPGKEEELHTIS